MEGNAMKLRMALLPVAVESVDSRSYIFAYPIRCPCELPGDFVIPHRLKHFTQGVFLPRAEPDWFGRRAYPPRVVLLSQDWLAILAHPASGEETQIVPLRELVSVEYGHFLLLGWISFASPTGIRVLSFNTRTSRPVEDLLSLLSKQWVPSFERHEMTCESFGSTLEIKFQNAERAALEREERVLARFFNPGRTRKHRAWGLFRVESREPGDYLAVTDRRLLWITDGYRGYSERYGSILRSAPLGNVIAISIDLAGVGREIVCRLKCGSSWRIPLPANQHSAGASFVERALPCIR